MSLNEAQQSAVEYLEGPLLVLAGPGTGKTQLLSAKVAYILEHVDGTNPENILCLTFTDAGASNMRARLAGMIGAAAANVNIFTYHAFGTSLIERYKNYAEVADRALNDSISDVAQYKIIRDIRDALPATDILKTAEIKDLAETIKNAKSARLSADDLVKIAEANAADAQKLGEIATECLADYPSRARFPVAEEYYQALLEQLATETTDEPIVANVERSANVLVRELDEILKAERAKDKPSAKPLTDFRKRHFELDADGNCRTKDYIANKKLASFANVLRSYDAKLRADGLYDYADMIEEAIAALKNDRGFRLSLSEIFQYILLDEFQDTNPAQFEIVKLLTDYERPVVMAVGDDDQAIYEFQGASASNLRTFQNYYNAKVIYMVDNYRSTGEILDFSHQVADQIVESFAKAHGVPKVLRSKMDLAIGKHGEEFCKTPTDIADSYICRHEFAVASDEYYWIARQIRALLDAGENPDEIAVIAPRHKNIGPLLPYLKEQNINIAYEKKSNILDDPKIYELVATAEFLHDLASEREPNHRLLELLSFPWMGVDALTAIKVIHAARADKSQKSVLEYLQKSDDARVPKIATWLAEMALASFETPLELWLDYLIGAATLGDFTSPYLAYYEAHSQKHELFEFYENLHVLRNTVMLHTKNKAPKLADFITTINDYRDAGVGIINTNPYRDAEHVVQVMSAHKSKGLEFEYVFLLSVDDLAWGKAKGNNNKLSLPSNLAHIRHTGATADERIRLLFVAITRAKRHLIMTNSVQDADEKQNQRLHLIGEVRDEAAAEHTSPYLPSGARKIQTHYDEFDADTRLDELRQDWVAHYQVLTPELKLVLQSQLEKYRLSATDLTGFVDIVYAGPDSIYKNRLLGAPGEPLTASMAYGTLVHGALEKVTNAGLDDTAAIEFLRDEAQKLPLTGREIADLQEKGAASLEIVLSDFRDILRKPGAKAEVNFKSENLNFDGVPLSGQIDHLEIDPQAKTIEVYDFKTGKFYDKAWDKQPSLYKYALQLEFYKLLLGLSPTYRDYKVARGHILFVSPDNEGKVYDKIYEFDVERMAELKKLIKAVYHQITSLDFVEDPELNLSADKSRTVKDIQDFISLLLSKSLI